MESFLLFQSGTCPVLISFEIKVISLQSIHIQHDMWLCSCTLLISINEMLITNSLVFKLNTLCFYVLLCFYFTSL